MVLSRHDFVFQSGAPVRVHGSVHDYF